jgi:hypothetical protein
MPTWTILKYLAYFESTSLSYCPDSCILFCDCSEVTSECDPFVTLVTHKGDTSNATPFRPGIEDNFASKILRVLSIVGY